jgi:prephenate dehydrogenase
LCYNSDFPELKGWRIVMPWKSVAIVGVGLIGGSIGLALRKRGLADEVVGIGHRASSLRKAKSLGIVTRTTTNLKRGVAESELVVICTPVEMISGLAVEIAQQATFPTLITDVGSTKSRHPLAGSEKTGPESARADLFEDRVTVVTPGAGTDPARVERVESFWAALGSHVLRMTPRAHDQAVAMASHVPHMIAAALAAATSSDELPLVAGGWRDTTRVAAGDPQLWLPIFRTNRDQVLKALDKFEKVLATFRAALEREDDTRLTQLLQVGKRTRDSVAS